METEKRNSIYDRLLDISVRIEIQTIPNPQYINESIGKCHILIEEVEHFSIGTKKEISMMTQAYNNALADYEYQKEKLFTEDEDIQNLPNIRDREAKANQRLRKELQDVKDYKNTVVDLKTLDSAINLKLKNLNRANQDIKMQLKVLDAQVRLGAGPTTDTAVTSLMNELKKGIKDEDAFGGAKTELVEEQTVDPSTDLGIEDLFGPAEDSDKLTFPIPEPQPEIQTEPEVSEPEVKTESEPVSKPEPQPETKPEPEAVAAEPVPEPESESKAETEPVPKPEPQPETKPEPEAAEPVTGPEKLDLTDFFGPDEDADKLAVPDPEPKPGSPRESLEKMLGVQGDSEVPIGLVEEVSPIEEDLNEIELPRGMGVIQIEDSYEVGDVEDDPVEEKETVINLDGIIDFNPKPEGGEEPKEPSKKERTQDEANPAKKESRQDTNQKEEVKVAATVPAVEPALNVNDIDDLLDSFE